MANDTTLVKWGSGFDSLSGLMAKPSEIELPVAEFPNPDQQVFEYRVERFTKLNFSVNEAESLAQVKTHDGTLLRLDRVEKALDNGATHAQALAIFI